jgi:release factor glutamine methyltransferase
LPVSGVVSKLRAAGCVFAEDEARLLVAAARTPGELDAMVERRASGLPLEQVVGWAEFCGRRVGVDPGVFVPRRRTEFLVQEAVRLARAFPARRPVAPTGEAGSVVVVDLCCGSGAVGLAVAAGLRAAGAGAVELHAADIEPAAVACARRNAAAAEAIGARVYQGDLYEPLPDGLRGRVNVLTANVPYVPSEEVALLPAEARDHEPRVALDGGADGLEVLRRVAAKAPYWLAPGGVLLTESSERQAEQAAAVLTASGLSAEVAHSDEWFATVVTGIRA